MDKSKFGNDQEAQLDKQYHNGQSEAEQLMHRHLQANEGALSEEALRNIHVTTAAIPPHPAAETLPEEGDSEQDGSIGPDRVITPLDVLGG